MRPPLVCPNRPAPRTARRAWPLGVPRNTYRRLSLSATQAALHLLHVRLCGSQRLALQEQVQHLALVGTNPLLRLRELRLQRSKTALLLHQRVEGSHSLSVGRHCGGHSGGGGGALTQRL